MHIDGYMALAGLIVGFTVGLTGMGGGALMTPILVLLFKVQPLAAVSSDLVAAVVMKPIGGAVHLRRGTVNKRLVGWLVAGSIPSAFAGVLILRRLGDGAAVQAHIKTALGVALLLAVATMIARAFLNVRRRAVKGVGITDDPAGVADHAPEVVIRPLPTLLVGVAGGLLVGMTSVGSLVWRLVRSTGGLRRDWEPVPHAHGEEFRSGAHATSPGGADVIPLSGARPAEASETAELAGRGR